MESSKKEQEIQENQNIQTAIQGTVIGLKSIYDYFDGEFDADTIGIVDIRDWEVKDYDNYAERIKDEYLSKEVANAHNKYVALLLEWQNRTGCKLAKLLT